MARPRRLHVPGGLYHVTLRGNHRQAIFRERGDRALLNAIVARALDEHDAKVHAYCWMTNHLHLLVEIADTPLGKIVLQIASGYARAFQEKLETTGHLFERRYHAVLIDAERYLLTLVRYIHMNPVRARLVSDASEYDWSSHRDYLRLSDTPWVCTGRVLGMFSASHVESIRCYAGWMGMDDGARWGHGALVPNATNKQVLGDDAFVKRIGLERRCEASTLTIDQLLQACSVRFALDGDAIASAGKSHDLSAARAWLCHEAISRGVAGASAMARFLRRDESTIRRLMTRRPRQ